MKTRRLLLILAAVLLICTSMVTAAYAVTDEEVADAKEINVGNEFVLDHMSAEDPAIYKFVPSEDGHYIFESSSEELVDTEGMICVKMGPDDYDWIAYDDQSGKDSNFSVSFAAEKDKEYYLFAQLTSGTTTVPVSVSLNKDPISQIAFEPAEPYDYTEYRDGYWTTDIHGNEMFRYYIPNEYSFKNGDALILTVSGSDVRYIFDEEEYAFVHDEEKILDDEVNIDDTQKENPWTPDKETNSFEVRYRSFMTIVPVTVNPSNVTSIEYTPAATATYYENDLGYGYWDYNIEKPEVKWFHYDKPAVQNGDIIKVKTTDDPEGTDYIYNDEDKAFISKDKDVIYEEEVLFSDDQDENHWYPDTDNYYTANFVKKACKVKIFIVESDITSISFTPATPYELVEGDGHYGNWEKNDQGKRVFVYSPPMFKDGDVLTVTKQGKDPVDYVYTSDKNGFVHGDDFISFYSMSRKIKGDWAPGADNKMEISYVDQKCEVDVKILPNPVRSFKYTPVEDFVLVKGNYDDGHMDEKDTWIYNTPYFRSGDVLSVTTDQGTEDYIFNKGTYCFECGEKTINDWQVYRTKGDDWAPGKDNYMTVFFAGTEVKVPVTIYEKHEHNEAAMELVAKVEPTCAAEGYEPHYDCKTCHQHFQKDPEEQKYKKTTLYSLSIPKLPHAKLTHVALKKATDKAAGNIDHWECSVCGACFVDAAGVVELPKDKVVIPKNNMTASARKKQYTAKSKKKTTFKAIALYKIKNKKGKVTFKKANKAGKSKITVAKNGNITVKKGIKKGTYKVRVKVTSAATNYYRACVKNVTIKIKVKVK